jgi:hypothetical protein
VEKYQFQAMQQSLENRFSLEIMDRNRRSHDLVVARLSIASVLQRAFFEGMTLCEEKVHLQLFCPFHQKRVDETSYMRMLLRTRVLPRSMQFQGNFLTVSGCKNNLHTSIM